jgi:hypothetical protein
MAERPVFLVPDSPDRLVTEQSVAFAWVPGLSPAQKVKNVRALHDAATKLNIPSVLEVSTKSDVPLGRSLSAFNLRVQLVDGTETSLECGFQGSKVFSRGGPFTDLYAKSSREAKQDERLRTSGDIRRFVLGDLEFPIEPKTAFYDWLYAKTLAPQKDVLQQLGTYAAFSDIEFNPKKSINCQARSCAVAVSLYRLDILEEAVASPDVWLKTLASFPHYAPDHSSAGSAQSDFAQLPFDEQ